MIWIYISVLCQELLWFWHKFCLYLIFVKRSDVNFAILYLFKQGNGFSLIKTPYNFIFFLLLLMENLILFKRYFFTPILFKLDREDHQKNGSSRPIRSSRGHVGPAWTTLGERTKRQGTLQVASSRLLFSAKRPWRHGGAVSWTWTGDSSGPTAAKWTRHVVLPLIKASGRLG